MSFCKLSKIILFCSLASSVNLNSMVGYGSGQNDQEIGHEQNDQEEGIEIPRPNRRQHYSREELLSLSASPLAIRPKDMSPIQGITISEESEE